jgi:hypothetical protein
MVGWRVEIEGWRWRLMETTGKQHRDEDNGRSHGDEG